MAGTWTIDPVHSEVGFSVRHMMVSKVRGKFKTFSGELVTADDPLASSVTAEIDLTSINTGQRAARRPHQVGRLLRGRDLPDDDLRAPPASGEDEDGYVLDGELTLKGVTRSVPLKLELNGFGPDPYGGTRAGFTATGELNRRDFNVNFSAADAERRRRRGRQDHPAPGDRGRHCQTDPSLRRRAPPIHA